jgi:general secretion pathway protein A
MGVESPELLQKLALGLGLNGTRGDSIVYLWRRVLDRLLEFRYQQQVVVILLDDIDQASPVVLAQVTRLVQHDRSPQSRLTLVLAGRNDRMSHLGPELAELAELRIDVEPWDERDTDQYLKTALAQAGCRRELFAPGAVARLHELACGIPRRVTQLADLSLLAAAGRELPQVDAEVVESAYHELGVTLV